MFIVDLKCINDHQFEGWYDDRGEYESIRAVGDLTCPLCETHAVERVLTTGEPKTSKTRERQERRDEIPVFEFVGSEFADRAIAMHRGEEPNAPIFGYGDRQDRERLDEEGVSYAEVEIEDEDEDEDIPEEIH